MRTADDCVCVLAFRLSVCLSEESTNKDKTDLEG